MSDRPCTLGRSGLANMNYFKMNSTHFFIWQSVAHVSGSHERWDTPKLLHSLRQQFEVELFITEEMLQVLVHSSGYNEGNTLPLNMTITEASCLSTERRQKNAASQHETIQCIICFLPLQSHYKHRLRTGGGGAAQERTLTWAE